MEINVTPSLQLREIDGDLFAVHIPTGTKIVISRKAMESWLLRLLRGSIK